MKFPNSGDVEKDWVSCGKRVMGLKFTSGFDVRQHTDMECGDREQHQEKCFFKKTLGIRVCRNDEENSELPNPLHRMFKSNVPNRQGAGRPHGTFRSRTVLS